MGLARGGDLGGARGSITIDTSQLAAARAAVQAFATGADSTLAGLNRGIGGISSSFGTLAGSMRGVASAFGVSFGIAGASQLLRMATAASDTATAYGRQEIAARSLAGSQQQLNQLLEAYDEATGGAIDRATALQNVTRLQAIGFADTAQELDQFARAIRGISLAMGQSQEYVTGQLQLAIANQSLMRLDQIGLGVSEVKQRVAELREENAGLTQQMAYQQAVLGLAEEKYGALADSAAGQATGVEKLTKSWKDYGLQLGLLISGPVNALAGAIAQSIDISTQKMRDFLTVIEQVEKALRQLGVLGIDMGSSLASRTSIGRVPVQEFAKTPFIEGYNEAKLDFVKGVEDINEQLAEDILDQERSYGRQRADTIEQYNRTMSREAQDFASNRLRQEQDLARSIAGIHEDAARREERMASDLARSIGEARSESGERIAEMREESSERLLELEEDYQREREKRARDHRDRLLDAAGRLDAKAVAEAQRNFARQEENAKEAYDEQRQDLQEQLQERIDDERENLAKRIRQATDAANRQLEDARAADAQRIADMQADFELRKTREDEDRATRLGRLTQDHNDQLAEMDRVHGDRLVQIRQHAFDERTALDEAHKEEMVAMGVRNDAWLEEVRRLEEERKKIYDEIWNPAAPSVTNPNAPPFIPGAGMTPIYPTPNVLPPTASASGITASSMTTNTSMAPVFNIYQQPGQSARDLADEIAAMLEGMTP